MTQYANPQVDDGGTDLAVRGNLWLLSSASLVIVVMV